MTWNNPIRFDDRLRFESGRERGDTLDDIAKIEHQLSRIHC